MQIIINEQEIIDAIKGFIKAQGIIAKENSVSVEIKNGRAPSGTSAIIEISNTASICKPCNTEVTKPVEDEVFSETTNPEPELNEGQEPMEDDLTDDSDSDALFD